MEADIKGFFDNVQHEWLMKFLGHRISDKRVLRYVKRFLRAGVFENGEIAATEQGTPQGGGFRGCWPMFICITALICGTRGGFPGDALAGRD